jgi:hypothetical protein
MKTLSIVALLTFSLFLSACFTTTIKTSTSPISAPIAKLVIDGKTTKTDIIAMFGQLNGFILSTHSYGMCNPQMLTGENPSNLLH